MRSPASALADLNVFARPPILTVMVPHPLRRSQGLNENVKWTEFLPAFVVGALLALVLVLDANPCIKLACTSVALFASTIDMVWDGRNPAHQADVSLVAIALFGASVVGFVGEAIKAGPDVSGPIVTISGVVVFGVCAWLILWRKRAWAGALCLVLLVGAVALAVVEIAG